MTEEKVELLTYCVLDEEGKNFVCPAPKKRGKNDEVFEKWEERYVGSFNETYLSSKETILDVQKYYFDPDGSYDRKSHPFFDHLITFLNKQEQLLSGKLAGSYRYSFEEEQGIRVASTNNPDVALFYLRSDQLGFSAPSNLKNHPYDFYLTKCEWSEPALRNVVHWIANTRTIGGSFLWPGEAPWDNSFYCKYNRARGGRSYIQDRVDLTLKEIDNWYSRQQDKDDIGNNDVLYNRKELSLENWLKHFECFETYVDFFCFDVFVDGKPRKPKMMLGENRGKVLPEEVLHQKSIQDTLSAKDLREMFDYLSENTLERSKAMLKIINNE